MDRSAATTGTPRFTREDYAALPSGFPAELVAGRLVKVPALTPGESTLKDHVLDALARVLVEPFVAIAGLWPVPVGLLDVYQPLVVVFRGPLSIDEARTRVPAVVFEVAAAGVAHDVLRVKRRTYLQVGVEEVWLLDPRARGIEAHTRAGVDAGTDGARVSSSVLRGFSLVPQALFGESAEPPPASPTPDA